MQQAYLDTISGRRTGIAAATARGALRVCAAAYAWGVRARNRRFDRPHAAVRLALPVISIGNLTTGGTGKTPVVAWVVNYLAARGRCPGIVSRGYRSLDGDSNDERRLLERLCPGVPHRQHPDRVAAARQLLAAHPCDVLVLDDGFQHRRLARDVDVVLIDALNPWGFGYLLPRGLLREPVSALRRASIVLITRADLVPPPELAQLRRHITRHTPAPIVVSSFRAAALTAADGATTPLAELPGRRVLAFCGIGNPEGFRRTLAAVDPALAAAAPLVFPDHHHYGAVHLEQIATCARRARADLLLTTEKDLVKLPPAIGSLPVRALRVAFSPGSGMEELVAALEGPLLSSRAA